MTVIQDNADRMPNEFKNIGKKCVINLFVLLVTLNWDHIRDINNSINYSNYSNVLLWAIVIYLQ